MGADGPVWQEGDAVPQRRALRGERRGWEGDSLRRNVLILNGSQIGTVTVEAYEEPTRHTVNVKRLLDWLKQPGRFSRDEIRQEKLRALVKVI